MKFTQEMIFTGKEKKISKRNNNEYTIANMLEKDTGKQVSVLAEKIEENIKMFDEVIVKFELIVGRYTSLKALTIESV